MSPNEQTTIDPKVFLLGLAWAVLSACAPVGVLLLDWLTRWNDPPDPTMVWHLAAACAVGGAVSFWRKHVALLKLPPALVQAKGLAQDSGQQ